MRILILKKIKNDRTKKDKITQFNKNIFEKLFFSLSFFTNSSPPTSFLMPQ